MPIILFCLFSVLFGLISAWWNHGLSQHASILILITSAVASIGTVHATKQLALQGLKGKLSKYTVWDKLMFFIWGVVSFRSFFWLIYESKNNWVIQAPNNLGDLAYHIHLIKFLESTKEYWPVNPIFSFSHLHYPIGADFFNSILLSAGLGLIPGLISVGFTGSMLIAYKLQKWGGAFAMAAFLFGGGTAIVGMVSHPAFIDWQDKVDWKNPYLAMIITQRGLLYAIPAGIWLLIQWRKEAANFDTSKMWLEVLILCTLPLFSIHTFLYFVGLLICLIIFNTNREYWIVLLAVSTLPSLLCLWLVTGFEGEGKIFWNPGWMPNGNTLTFWINNFGVIIPLMVICTWQCLTNSTDRAFAIGASCCFVLCTIVSFAPWPWDNTKLMVWSWITILPLIWEHILRHLAVGFRIIVLAALFITGATSVAYRTTTNPNIILLRLEEKWKAQELTKGLDRTSKIAAAPTYNHPLSMLGFPLIAGYEGHLWSHGINYRKELSLLKKVLQGEAGWEDSAKQLGINYIYWGNEERKMFPTSAKLWEAAGFPTTQVKDTMLIEISRKIEHTK